MDFTAPTLGGAVKARLLPHLQYEKFILFSRYSTHKEIVRTHNTAYHFNQNHMILNAVIIVYFFTSSSYIYIYISVILKN